MAADAKANLCGQNVMSQETYNMTSGSKRKQKGKGNTSTCMPPPIHVGLSSSKRNVSHSYAMGPTITEMYGKLTREDADDAIGRFIFANGIPFHVARSPYYKEMARALVATSPSYVPLGEHNLRMEVLGRQVSKINVQKEQMRETWARSGCSIVMDGWIDITKRPLINIIVTCIDGPFFLRAVNCLSATTTPL